MRDRRRSRHDAPNRWIWLALAFVLSGSPGIARAIPIVVDQSHLNPAILGTNYRNFAQLGQSFTPTAAKLNVVELAFNTFGASEPTALRVDIREGGVAGAVIGSSRVSTTVPDVRVNLPIEVEDFTQFVFRSPVALVPGNLYVIDLVYLSGPGGFWLGSQFDAYAGGNGFRELSPLDGDFTFRTGTGSVPEPSTALLLILSLVGARLATKP